MEKIEVVDKPATPQHCTATSVFIFIERWQPLIHYWLFSFRFFLFFFSFFLSVRHEHRHCQLLCNIWDSDLISETVNYHAFGCISRRQVAYNHSFFFLFSDSFGVTSHGDCVLCALPPCSCSTWLSVCVRWLLVYLTTWPLCHGDVVWARAIYIYIYIYIWRKFWE